MAWRRLPRSHTRRGEDLDDELASYLDHEIADNIARGMTPAAARSAARRKLGNRTMVREAVYELRSLAQVESIAKDLAFGVRQMRRQPAFALAAIAILALGIAATTAIFSVAYSVLLRSLPYGEPHRLVALSAAGVRQSLQQPRAGAADYFDWRRRQQVFEDLALTRPVANFNLTGSGEPERLQGARATASLFSTLRVVPLLGRTFTEAEQLDPARAGSVAVLSHGLWQRRFAGDSSIVGRTILLNGTPTEVLGVMGPAFQYPSREFELWTPLYIPPAALAGRRDYSYLAVARMKPGVTLEAARAQMAVVASDLAREHPNTNAGVYVGPLLQETTGSVRRVLWLILAGVAALFTVACVNLANLVLARAANRRREFALRTSLGASRARLARQLACEMAPLAAAGGAAGLLGARWLLDLLLPLLPSTLPRVEEIDLHGPVLAAAVLLAAATAFVVALAPAARAGASVERGPAAAGRLPDLLIIGQIACTIVLLVVAGLLVRSFAHLRSTDPGLQPAEVLSLHLAINRTKHGDDPGVARYLTTLLESVRRVPSVHSAGIVNRLPMGGQSQIGAVRFERADRAIDADWRSASGDYFRALGVPLLAGRTFDARDTSDRPLVGVIDQRLARAVFGDANPVGQRFRMDFPDAPWTEVIGVVGHLRHDGLDVDPRPQVYWSYLQRTQDRMAMVVKSTSAPAAIAPAVRAAIRAVDPEQPLYDVRPMTEVIDRTLQGYWLNTSLLGAFAAMALLLASVGLYGVVSYLGSRRRREFGVRMAIGATSGQVARLVLWQGLGRAVAGTAIGLAAAALLARTIASFLHGVSPWDPLTFIAAPAALSLVVLLASALPAWRAARLDPTLALRQE
jgi:putative ABC transport system permease protein